MRVSAFARTLAALVLLVSWTAGGWAAACASAPPAPEPHAHALAIHHPMHGAMHHRVPTPSPSPEHHRAPRGGERPDCPLLAMNGGSCLGAAHLPVTVSAPASSLAASDGYPPAAGVRDRLMAISVFHPPRA